jgi:hypothetical protein
MKLRSGKQVKKPIGGKNKTKRMKNIIRQQNT